MVTPTPLELAPIGRERRSSHLGNLLDAGGEQLPLIVPFTDDNSPPSEADTLAPFALRQLVNERDL
jgi:hypothetical protein